MTNVSIAEGAPRPFGFLARALLRLTFIHQDVLAACPPGDIAIAFGFAVLQVLSTLWTGVLFANALRIMLSPDGSWQFTAIAVAAIMALILMLADGLIFIAASWHAHGVAEIERTEGFTLPRSLSDRAKSVLLIGARLVMSLLIVNVLAVAACLLAFQKDIDRILGEGYAHQNAVLLADAAKREDAELATVQVSLRDLQNLLSTTEADERRLRAVTVDPAVADEPLKLAFAQLAAAQKRKVEADSELAAAQVFAARERGGDCGAAGLSCVAGEGPRWRAARDRVGAAQHNAMDAAAALTNAQKQVDELQRSRGSEMVRKTNAANTQLGEVSARRAALERQYSDRKRAYDTRLASRESTIHAAVEADPRHVAKGEGLLDRLRALKQLSNDQAIAPTLFGLDALLMLLELAAVMGKTVALVPMSYATRIAELDLVRALQTAQRLSEAFGKSNRPEPIPEETPDQGDGAGEPASEPSVTVVPRTRPRRHAQRWRPDFSTGSDRGNSASEAPEPANHGPPLPSQA